MALVDGLCDAGEIITELSFASMMVKPESCSSTRLIISAVGRRLGCVEGEEVAVASCFAQYTK